MKSKTWTALAVFFASVLAQAQEVAHAAPPVPPDMNRGWIGLAAGLAIGLAAIGGALGQGKTAAAALDGIARNPAAQGKIFAPMIIGLALIESLVIYAFVISFSFKEKFKSFFRSVFCCEELADSFD